MSNSINRELYKPTTGEKLWFYRRAWGWTLEVAAKKNGTNRPYYVEMEYGRRPATGLPIPSMKKLTMPEMLQLARRRSALGLDEIARLNRVSRPTIYLWEKTGEPRLVTFWEKRGFRFHPF